MGHRIALVIVSSRKSRICQLEPAVGDFYLGVVASLAVDAPSGNFLLPPLSSTKDRQSPQLPPPKAPEFQGKCLAFGIFEDFQGGTGTAQLPP